MRPIPKSWRARRELNRPSPSLCNVMLKFIKAAFADDVGKRVIEYTMIVSLSLVVIFVTVPILGAKLDHEFVEIGDCLK